MYYDFLSTNRFKHFAFHKMYNTKDNEVCLNYNLKNIMSHI